MGKIKKIILDTIESHPLHRSWLRLAEQLANEAGVPLEVKKEDYVFAITHGDTDDLGMAWLPQLFAELEDGTVKLVLSQFPFDPKTTQPDPEEALRKARGKLREISGDP